jgi:sec-independent protein translocase protein TatC
MEERLSWALVIDQVKRKLMQLLAIVAIGFTVTFTFSDLIIKKITDDLLPMEILNPSQNNPCLAPTQLISTSPTEVVMVKLQISVLFGIFLALPFLAYWIIQRLKRRYEINTVSLALWGVAAFTLFEIGFAFTYFIILPTAYKILVALTTGANIIPLFSINQFMLFTVISLLLFSLSFEFPLVVTWLTVRGMVTVDTLKARRKYVYVLIVLVAAVITADPTPFSQLLLSGPLIFLYEVSILVSGIIRKSEKRVR